MEKIIDRQIRDQFLPRIPLHDLQYAYEAGKSCELAIQDKGLAVATFLGLAYDNTTFLAIKEAAIYFSMGSMTQQHSE